MKTQWKPSPNFDTRKLPISLIVLHYTGMKDGASALKRLRDPEAKVSAHFVVGEDGRITQLVDVKNRAWHAGVSSWNGITDVNSASIGIEIINGGHDFGLPAYPKAQVDAVTALCQNLISKHNISPFGIVGHSDIAPARKQDPGEKFPWQDLARQGVGVWPKNSGADQRVLFEKGAADRGVSILQRGLAYLGYDVSVTATLDEETQAIVKAFQRRYRPDLINGIIDVQTLELITDLANQNKSA